MEQSVLLSAASVYMDVLRDEANLQLQRDNVRVLRQTLIVAQELSGRAARWAFVPAPHACEAKRR